MGCSPPCWPPCTPVPSYSADNCSATSATGRRVGPWPGATLAVAALLQPARRWVQQTVDRRFNRRRYDAARTVEAFSTRLREQVDLSTLSSELLAVVDQTVQPVSAPL